MLFARHKRLFMHIRHLCPEGKKFTLLLADNGILLCNQVLQVVFCDRFGTRRAVIVPTSKSDGEPQMKLPLHQYQDPALDIGYRVVIM